MNIFIPLVLATALAQDPSAAPSGTGIADWPQRIAYFWPIALVLSVLMVAAVVWLVLRVLNKRRATQAKPNQQNLAEGLWQQWCRFRKGLPRKFADYPVVVVISSQPGEGGRVVDYFLQWREHPELALLAETCGGSAGFYAGQSALVIELSSALASTRDPQALRALTKIWKQANQRLGIVILAIPGPSLLPDAPEAQAFAAFLSAAQGCLESIRKQAYGQRIRVRALVAESDRLPGFAQLTNEEFVRSQGVLDIRPTPLEDAEAEVARALQKLCELPRYDLAFAARSLPGTQLRELLTFHEGVAQLARRIHTFCSMVASTQHSSYILDAIAFFDGAHTKAAGLPFEVDRFEGDQLRHRLDAVRIARAVTLAGIALAASVGIQYDHLSRFERAESAVQRLERSELPKEPFLAGIDQSRALAEDDAGHALLAMWDSEILWTRFSAAKRKSELAMRYDQQIEYARFHPILSNASASASAKLGALALLYSASDESLRNALAADLDFWATLTGTPIASVAHYLALHRQPWTGDLAKLWREPTANDLPGFSADWASRLQQIEQAFDAQSLDDAQIAQVRELLPATLLSDSKAHFLALSYVAGVLGQHTSVRVALDETVTRGQMSGWVGENYDVLTRLRAVVAGSLPEDQVTPTTLNQLRRQLLALAPPRTIEVHQAPQAEPVAQDPNVAAPTEPEPSFAAAQAEKAATPEEVLTLRLGATDYRFSVNKWRQLTRAQAAKDLVRRYLDQIALQSENLLLSQVTEMPPLGLPGNAKQGPSGTVARTFTRAFFQTNIAPAVVGFAADLDRLQEQGMLDEESRSELDAAIVAAMQDYATQYRDAYDEFCGSVQLGSSSAQQIYDNLNQLTYSKSWLVDFLAFVSKQTSLELDEADPFVEPLTVALAAYEPLHDIMVEDKGTYPGLAAFVQIYVDLIAQVQAIAPQTPTESGEGSTSLLQSVNPLGGVYLKTLRSEIPDARTEMRKQLALSHLTVELGDVLLQPIDAFYTEGERDLNRAVHSAWRQHVLPVLRPVVSSFPFDLQSDAALSVDQIAGLVGPKGHFYAELTARLGEAIADAQDADFHLVAGIRIPEDYEQVTGEVRRLTETLWDSKGKPQPLQANIYFLPLTRVEYEDRVATMAFVAAGDNRVSGFNDRPSAKSLTIAWDTPQAAQLGITFTKPSGAGSDVTLPINIDAQPFAFFRLLSLGQPILAAKYRLSWTLSKVETGISLTTEFDKDPWLDVALPHSTRALGR